MLEQRQFARAQELYRDSLALQRQLRFQQHVVDGLEGLAGVAVAWGQPGRAARLLAATESTTAAARPSDQRRLGQAGAGRRR